MQAELRSAQLLLLGGLLASMVSPAAAQPTGTAPGPAVSVQARRAVSDALRGAATGTATGGQSLAGDGRVSLIVQVDGGADTLRNAGIAAQSLTPSFAAVNLPAADIDRLWRVPGLRRVDGHRTLRTRLDRSVPLIGATAMHALGLRGQGSMVAVLDTGIDFRNPDFRNADGSSRIAYLLDASTPRGGLHPELPDSNSMAVYTKADIDALLTAEAAGHKPMLPIPQTDTSGHGTHVAGIAAGNGRATGKGQPFGRYVGVAPEATLCIVQGTRADDSFADMDILTGVRFCVDRAAALGMPVVANLSLGAGGGAHDGQTALELMLDELLNLRRAGAPARLMVAASGNAGSDDIHASGRLLDGMHEIPLKLDPVVNVSGKAHILLELYYEASAPHTTAGTAELSIELRSPGGKVLRIGYGEANQGRFAGEGEAQIDLSDTTPPLSNANASAPTLRGAYIYITSESETSPIKSGQWLVRLSGRTLRYDLWMSDASPDLTVGLTRHLDPDGYVEIPAAARNAISVGSFRDRLDWVRPSGLKVTFDRENNRVSPFSSGGPTRDGRFAPDLLAPGEFIISSLSTDAPPSSPRSVFSVADGPDFLLAEDGAHGVLRGTSQATPHVAGALALLLQLRPDLSVSQARELLRTTSTTDLGLSAYGPRRGFGLLNVPAAVAALRGSVLSLGPVDALHSDIGTNQDTLTPGYGEATITVTPRDSRGAPLGPGHKVEIWSDAGTWLGPTIYTGPSGTGESPATSFGRYERTLRANGPLGTVATVVARIDDVLITRRLTLRFVADPDQIGAPYSIAGCGMAPHPPAPIAGTIAPGLLALCGLAWARYRRRMRRHAHRLAAPVGLLSLLLPACADADTATGNAAINPAAPMPQAGPTSVRRPRFPPGGDYFWSGPDAPQMPSVRIHLATQHADIFDGPTLIGRSSICSGRRSHRTPAGPYTVTEKIAEHVSNRYGDYVDDSGGIVQANIDSFDVPAPPGTQFRGTKMPYFLRIVGGVGLHAGPLPGFPDSHGCVRFPEPVAQRLFQAAFVGMAVVVED